ncbi:MAG TPA: glycosyltransferase family 4 protein [Verrucomicrobiota bacterium]|nr:hypothetical protein [Verrucomicrobiales bacterium]HRI13713.1 glycosyltransferase family 4 protein [Verrucomicrobiota bacterium]
MCIVFVCNELPPAPSDVIGPVVAVLAQGLAAAGNEVTVVGTYDQDYGWNYPGVRVIPLLNSQRRWFQPFACAHDLRRWAIYRELGRLRLRERIDVVEWSDREGLFVQPIPGVTDVLRNRGLRVETGSDAFAAVNPTWENLAFRTLRSIPNWIGLSQWLLNEWLRISEAQPVRTAVAYDPIDLDLFRPEIEAQKLDPNLVLYAGSFRPAQGALSLIKAANLFLRQCPDARLEMYGEEMTSVPQLEGRLADDLRDRVTWSGPLPESRLAIRMRRAAVFAMPSLLESFGTAWMEAMASGVAVVGSRMTCGPEIVQDGVTGLLTDPTNPPDVAHAIVRLLGEPALRHQMGTAGRQFAERRYSVEAGVRQTLAFYEACHSQRQFPDELEVPLEG